MNTQRAVKRSQLQKGDGSLIRRMGQAGVPPFLKTPVRATMRVPRRCTCRASIIHRSSLAGDSTGERMESPAVGARWQKPPSNLRRVGFFLFIRDFRLLPIPLRIS
jgi:hypothetical protein